MDWGRYVERFLMWRMEKMNFEVSEEEKGRVGIWAHRGCSMRFPENTLQAFEEAAKLPGLKGIEMDVQYSSDHEMVVFHDETLDRVTGEEGYVKDHTLAELKALKFKNCENFPTAGIPTLREFLEDMKPYCEKGMLINIELKTSEIRYEGIEQDAYNLVKELGMCDSIVWSSFLADSIKIMKEIDPNAKTGMLASKFSDCKKLGEPMKCDAYHPACAGMTGISKAEIEANKSEGRIIRAWNSDEPLYHLPRPKRTLDLRNYAYYGVTDIITNVPERYLTKEFAHIMDDGE